METRQIYMDEKQLPVNPKDWACFYGSELATCERLLTMGYQFCGHVNIAKRAEYLEKEIARLQDIFKSFRLQ
jgi:hypothetical protein